MIRLLSFDKGETWYSKQIDLLNKDDMQELESILCDDNVVVLIDSYINLPDFIDEQDIEEVIPPIRGFL